MINNMDLEQIKNLLKDGTTKVVVIEEGKPIMVISGLAETSNQARLAFDNPEKKEARTEKQEPAESKQEISQSTEVISKEEMPVDELRVEDLPF